MNGFNEIEHEVIVLNSVWGMIDDMVNLEMFEHPPTSSEAQLTFRTQTHRRLFNVLLGDFLSLPSARGSAPLPFNLPRPPPGSRSADQTHLFYLRRVCASSKFGDTSGILSVVDGFSVWLEETATVEKVWFSAVDVEENVKITRISLIKICGNIGKHNFLRLSQNVGLVRELLAEHGHEINEGDAFLVLPEFYDWFHTNVFAYHASTIAEFLNSLRFELYKYLRPEFDRSYHAVSPTPKYRFHIPDTITQPFARAMYWDLMNMVRSGPRMQRFQVSAIMKKRY